MQAAFDVLYRTVLSVLNFFYPLRIVIVSSRGPHFVTPRIKFLLRPRNKLMRKGAVTAAESITSRKGHSQNLFSEHPRGSKELWRNVRKVTGKEKRGHGICSEETTVDQLNQYFASLSTDLQYKPPLLKSSVSNQLQLFTKYSVFRILNTLKSTTRGLDGLPNRFIRLSAPSLLSLSPICSTSH